MVRWVVFDDDTAEAVVSRLRRGAAEIQHNAPVDAALQTQGPSVIVLPSPTPGKLLIARFCHRKEAVVAPASVGLGRYPSGLRSAPALGRKPATAAQKPWWRKIVA
jgi:hypothetical protein